MSKLLQCLEFKYKIIGHNLEKRHNRDSSKTKTIQHCRRQFIHNIIYYVLQKLFANPIKSTNFNNVTLILYFLPLSYEL